jgi:ADP-heptose:LPS heptosyltransferase
MKPKLLVVELWGLGDLVIATPFLRAASERFSVTLLAKPYAKDLQERFWTGVTVVPFTAPWTAFKHKYRVLSWPWGEFFKLRRTLAAERFDYGLSARWDPRDHLLLQLVGARNAFGFPRIGSQLWLRQPLSRPDPAAHRYEYWRVMAEALGFELPSREKLVLPRSGIGGEILVHTGAGQAIRVWPLERYARVVAGLREKGFQVQVACDPDQHKWWLSNGEPDTVSPRTVTELLGLVDRSSLFIGNDSGPGHLAAFCGVPTFSIFGPQLPEWFAPLHPRTEALEGKACPFKPCSDYCRFPAPLCMVNSTVEEVLPQVLSFVAKNLAQVPATGSPPHTLR